LVEAGSSAPASSAVPGPRPPRPTPRSGWAPAAPTRSPPRLLPLAPPPAPSLSRASRRSRRARARARRVAHPARPAPPFLRPRPPPARRSPLGALAFRRMGRTPGPGTRGAAPPPSARVAAAAEAVYAAERAGAGAVAELSEVRIFVGELGKTVTLELTAEGVVKGRLAAVLVSCARQRDGRQLVATGRLLTRRARCLGPDAASPPARPPTFRRAPTDRPPTKTAPRACASPSPPTRRQPSHPPTRGPASRARRCC